MKINIHRFIQIHAFQKLLRITSIILIALVFGNTVQAQSPLCSSGPTSFCCEYISALSINAVSQNVASSFSSGSSNLGYYDFTSSSISTLTAGSTYPVTVTVVTSNNYREYVKLWFDFNGNGVLSDVGELVFDQNKTFASGGETLVYSGNITVPLTAFNGDIYIRVMMVYNAVPTLCGNYSYGNTVDLKATIIGGATGRTLTVTIEGAGSGDVVSTPSGINTGTGQNSAVFTDGTTVSLAATPVSPSLLTAWSGDASGSANPLDVTMDAAKNITATFGLVSVPSVTTTAISSITSTTASSGGNVTSDGGAAVTVRGVCWKTSSSPTIADSKTSDGTGTGAFSSSITGLTAGQTYYVRAYATNSEGTAYGGEESFVSANTWDGSSGTDWGTAANWSDNAVPTPSTIVNIPDVGVVPIISSTTSANCNNLTVAAGVSLVINSDATSSGSLIVSGTSTGNITYNRYLTGSSTNWHLIGVPVEGHSINDFVTAAGNSIARNGDKYGLGIYDEANNDWLTYTTTTASGAGNLLPGMGYEILRTADGIVSFTGTVSNSNVNTAVVNDGRGWNSVGNPFPSALCANSTADGTNNFITVNTAELNDAYEAVYIWNSSTSFYDILNNASGATYIPPGQGFIMKAASAGTLNLTREMRTHQPSATFKNTENAWPEINLKVLSGEIIRTTKIKYIEGTSLGLDPGYDAGMFDGVASDISIYSRLLEENPVKFGLQCLPADNYENMVIPIEIESSTNSQVILSADILNFPPDINVYLEDCLKNTFTLLGENETYTTIITEGNSGNRFKLHSSRQLLGVNDDLKNADNYKIICDYSNSSIRIVGELGENTVVSLIDLAGRILFQTSLNGNNEIKVPNLKIGIYILRLANSDLKISKKVYWK